jgi:hypothetical protein
VNTRHVAVTVGEASEDELMSLVRHYCAETRNFKLIPVAEAAHNGPGCC